MPISNRNTAVFKYEYLLEGRDLYMAFTEDSETAGSISKLGNRAVQDTEDIGYSLFWFLIK
jgi:hypothetical protein